MSRGGSSHPAQAGGTLGPFKKDTESSRGCRISDHWRSGSTCTPGLPRSATLPFSCPFGATKGGKQRQTTAQSESQKSLDSSGDGARSGKAQQPAAKSGYRRLFRLLTGGLLVRIQPEEPTSHSLGLGASRALQASPGSRRSPCSARIQPESQPPTNQVSLRTS